MDTTEARKERGSVDSAVAGVGNAAATGDYSYLSSIFKSSRL